MIGRPPIFEERLQPLLRLAARIEGIVPHDDASRADADALVDLGAAHWKRHVYAGEYAPKADFVLHATVPGLASLLDAQIHEAAGLADLAANNPTVAADGYFRRLQYVLRRRPA